MTEHVSEIALDGAAWRTKEDFYSAILPALGAPPGHGRNLDALDDSLVGGDINAVNPPLVVRVRGLLEMGNEARNVVERFSDLIRDLKAQGVRIDLFVA